jgi:hypothetical protein
MHSEKTEGSGREARQIERKRKSGERRQAAAGEARVEAYLIVEVFCRAALRGEGRHQC